MNELDMLKIIHEKLSVTDFLGNDCAKLYIPNCSSQIHITQDTLVEDVHFSLKTTNAYELAQKAVSVNISDLCAALAKPLYISISLSLPKDISSDFIEAFYEGINTACTQFGCVVAGGDLTRSEKIVISICAIGQQTCTAKVGRNYAQEGDLVLLTGLVGSSSLGLLELSKNPQTQSEFTSAHLCPQIGFAQSKQISELNPESVCIMDTSDGLADAIFKISHESNVSLDIDGTKIPKSDKFAQVCKDFKLDENNQLLFGAEDFGLLITLAPKYVKKLNKEDFSIIGTVKNKTVMSESIVRFKEDIVTITENSIKINAFKHFED